MGSPLQRSIVVDKGRKYVYCNVRALKVGGVCENFGQCSGPPGRLALWWAVRHV